MPTLDEVLGQILSGGAGVSAPTTPNDVMSQQAGGAGVPDLPRGIRNNNPGNIRRSAINWQGEVEGADPEFESFDTPEAGLQALETNLQSYQDKHGLNTVRGIINRWAPSTENDTGAYVNAVSQRIGVTPDDPISVSDPAMRVALRDAIVQHENGQNPYAGAQAIPAGVDPEASRRRAIQMREQYSQQPQQPDVQALIGQAAALLRTPPVDPGVGAVDFGRAALGSVGGLGSMAAGLGEYGARKAEAALGANGPTGGSEFWSDVTDQFRGMRQTTDAFAQEQFAKMSPEAQARAGREILNLDPDQTIWQGGVGEFMSSVALKGAQSLAPTVGPLLGYALLARMGAGGAASTLYGMSEGALSAGGAAADMAKDVETAPIEVLMGSEQFQKRLKDAGGNEVAARQAFINDVQGVTPVIAGAIVGLIAKGTSKPLDDFFKVSGGAALSKRVGTGALSEGVQEFGQSSAEQVAQNVARRVYNSETGVWDGVLEAGLQGALVGAPLGGAVSGAFGRRKAIEVDTSPVPADVASAVSPVPVGAPKVPEGLGQVPPPAEYGPGGQGDFFGGGGRPEPTQMPLPFDQPAQDMGASPEQGELFSPQPQGDLFSGFEPSAPPAPTQQAVPTDPFNIAGMTMSDPPPPPAPPNSGPSVPEGVLPFDPNVEVPTPQQPLPYQPAEEDVVKIGEQSDPGRDVTAEPVNDILAQMEDMKTSDRKGVYLSKANLQNLKKAGALDQVLRSGGVPIRNFDGSGGVLVAKDTESARELIEMRDSEAASLDEVLGYATGSGSGKPAGSKSVLQKYDAAGNVVRESLIAPGTEQELIKQWGGDPKQFRTVPLAWALARRREQIKVEERSRAKGEKRNKGQAEEKVSKLYVGAAEKGHMDAQQLIADEPDLTEDEIGEKLFQYALETRQSALDKRMFQNVPEPGEVSFRGRELTQAARRAESADPKEAQKAKGQISGSTAVAAERSGNYKSAYQKLVDADIRVGMAKAEGDRKEIESATEEFQKVKQQVLDFLQVEGGYTHSEALTEAASKFSPKTRKELWGRTLSTKKDAVEQAASQRIIDRPVDVTSDEMTDSQAAKAGKVRNVTDIAVAAKTPAQAARAEETSVRTTAVSPRVKLRTKRANDAAKKLAPMLNGEVSTLLRHWLSDYRRALRDSLPDDNTRRLNAKVDSFAARVSEALGNLNAQVAVKDTREAAASNLAEKITLLTLRAGKLGVSKETDPDGLFAAIESGDAGKVSTFLKSKVTKTAPASQLPESITEEELKALDPVELNSMYVQALNELDSERASDVVRGFMVRGVKKHLNKFSSKVIPIQVVTNAKTKDSPGAVVEVRHMSAKQAFDELISGGKSIHGTKGDRRMPIEQLRVLYAEAVKASDGELPAVPMQKYQNRLAQRVAPSDKISEILRAVGKRERSKLGGKATGITRSANEGVADKYTKTASTYNPGVLLANNAPRDLRGDRAVKYQTEVAEVATDLATAIKGARRFLTKIGKGEYQEQVEELGEDGQPTKGARNAMRARAYASWVVSYAEAVHEVGPASAAAIAEAKQLVEDLNGMPVGQVSEFVVRMNAAFKAEESAQDARAERAIGTKKDAKDKGQWLAEATQRTLKSMQRLNRIQTSFRNNPDFNELISPILDKVREGITRDGWYSYAPSAEEKEAVEFLFAQWSHDEQWLEKLTKKQREMIERTPVDPELKSELYDPLKRMLDSAGFFDRAVALEKRYVKKWGTDAEVAPDAPRGQKEYDVTLRGVEGIVEQFVEVASDSKATVDRLAAAEHAAIEALRKLGAWRDLSKKDGTGIISLPNPAALQARIDELQAKIRTAEAQMGRHTVYDKRRKETKQTVVGGERVDSKGRLLGVPDAASGVVDMQAEVNDLSQTLRQMSGVRRTMEPIHYRRLGTRLEEKLATKREFVANANSLKMQKAVAAIRKDLTEQQALPLDAAKQPKKPAYKGPKAQKAGPTKQEIELVVDQLALGLNLDLTSAGGDHTAPTTQEREAFYFMRDTLTKRKDVKLSDLFDGMGFYLGPEHPYAPLIERLRELGHGDMAVNATYFDSPTRLGRMTLVAGKPTILISQTHLDSNSFEAKGMHVLLHEAVHAATVTKLATDHKLRGMLNILRGVTKEQLGDQFSYATGDVYEFVAEAMSNAEFQRALKNVKVSDLSSKSLWARFVGLVRQLLGIDQKYETLLDAVMTLAPETLSPDPVTRESLRTVQEGDAQEKRRLLAGQLNDTWAFNMTEDAFGAPIAAKLQEAFGSRAAARKTLVEQGRKFSRRGGFEIGKFMVKAMSMDQLHAIYKTSLPGLNKWMDNFRLRNSDAAKALEDADKFSREWTTLEERDSASARKLSELMVDATMEGIHPNEEFAPGEKGTPNGHLTKEHLAKWQELNAQWNSLPTEVQALYTKVKEYYRKTIERESKLLLLNALRASSLWEGDFTLTEDDIHLGDDESFRDWVEKTLKLDTKGDRKTVKELRAKFEKDEASLTKEERKARRAEVREAEGKLDSELDQLRIISKMASIPTMREGPYFPLRRFGDFVVRARKKVETKAFEDRDDMIAWVNEKKVGDPTLQFKYPNKTTVEVYEEEFQTAETLTEADEIHKEMVAKYGGDSVSDVDRKANLFSTTAAIPHNAALQTLLGKLEGNPGAQAAMRNFYIQSLSDHSFRKGELKRKNIRGVAATDQHRTFAHYAKSATYYTAQLRYGHLMASAKQEMSKHVSEHRDRPGETPTLRLRQVVEEIELRDEQAAEIHDLPGFIRKSAEFGQFMLLTSPSYWMINATQPWMVTVPWLSGYTSLSDATNSLRKAQAMIVSPLLTEAKNSLGGFKALWSKTSAESAFSVLEQVEAQILKSGRPDAKQIVGMLSTLKRESIIDLSWVAELRQIAAGNQGALGEGWNKVMDASRVMAHLTEVNNRIMTAIAAYDIAKRRMPDSDDSVHVEFAGRAVRETQFNYSAANKPRLFSANDAAWKPMVFQFMQYMQHMYFLMFQQVGRLVSKDLGPAPKKQAARILGGMLGTHLIAGGIVGMTIQPIKWAFGLLAMLGGDDPEDADDTFRNAVSGETYDRAVAEGLAAVFGGGKMSETLRAGLPRLAGFDLSSRMSLGQIYMADLDPKNAETLAGSIAMSFLGPMPGLLGNMYDGTKMLMEEGPSAKAFEKFSPKGVRDVIRAFRYADEGVTDNSGKVIMNPNKLDPVDLFWQTMGFAPSQLSEMYTRNAAVKDRQQGAQTQKAAVMKLQRLVRSNGNRKEAIEALRDYNRRFPENRISMSEVTKSLKQRNEDELIVQRTGATLRDRERSYAKAGDPYNVD